MPLPAGLLAAFTTAGSFTGVLGSGADYASLAFTLVDHLKAQEGLKYNPHAFSVAQAARPGPSTPAAPTQQPSSATSPGQSRGKSAAALQPRPVPSRLTAGFALPLLSIRGSGTLVDFRSQVYFLDNPAGTQEVLHIIHLWGIRGFATEVGDQAELEFSGQEVSGGYLLSVKGIVNELFTGFFHFWCDYMIPSPTGPSDASDIRPLMGKLSGEGGTLTQREDRFVIRY